MLTDDNGSVAVAWRARAESQGGSWALCYDSSTDCTACPSATVNDPGYGHCSCPSGSTNTFHGGCDAHTQTVVIGHNSLRFTFGGFAQATWAGNGNAGEAAGDFLFRLGPGAGPVAYRPTGKGTHYQYRNPGYWPLWGGHDLGFGGYSGALGQGFSAFCNQGDTYAGQTNDACGGDGNWGATEMEVWYRVGS